MVDKRLKHKDALRDEALKRALFDGVYKNPRPMGETVRLMQKVSKLTQPEFAAHRGVSTRVLKEIMAGTANPTVETLNKIASIFGMEVGFIAKRPETRRQEMQASQALLAKRSVAASSEET